MTLGGQTHKPVAPDEELCFTTGDVIIGSPSQVQVNSWLNLISLRDQDGKKARLLSASVNNSTRKFLWVFSTPKSFKPKWLVVNNQMVDLSLVNIAPKGYVRASSTFSRCFAPDKVVDGLFLDDPECNVWASKAELAGAWVEISFDDSYKITRVVLSDRPNIIDQVLSGRLEFSDGSSWPVGSLPNDGSPLAIEFPEKSVTWVRFVVLTADGINIGLAEMQIYGR